MKLVKMSIYNFRSIIKASDIELSNYTILIGKNNEGKTNVLSALNIAMNTIFDGERPYRARYNGRNKYRLDFVYDPERDYPVSKKDSISKNPTRIILNMNLNEEEKDKFKKHLGFSNNGDLTLEIKYCLHPNNEAVVVPEFIFHGKKGKGASTYSNNRIQILKFIHENFKFTYIPAIRTSDKIYYTIENIISNQIIDLKKDKEYNDALEIISKKEVDKLSEIGAKLKDTLIKFLPEIKSTSINATVEDISRRNFSLKNWDLMIDDGTLTNISFKGDGVKNLVSLALLKEYDYNNDGLVAIEEPESHLHSGAIHQLDQVLREISCKQQVIITTHNACFVNKNKINSNLLVSNGQCKPIATIQDLRNELGISISETLVTTDYVILVEGKTDEIILTKLLSLVNDRIRELISDKILSFYNSGSSSKISSYLNMFERWLVKCYSIVDFDSAGREVYNHLKKEGKNPLLVAFYYYMIE